MVPLTIVRHLRTAQLPVVSNAGLAAAGVCYSSLPYLVYNTPVIVWELWRSCDLRCQDVRVFVVLRQAVQLWEAMGFGMLGNPNACCVLINVCVHVGSMIDQSMCSF